MLTLTRDLDLWLDAETDAEALDVLARAYAQDVATHDEEDQS